MEPLDFEVLKRELSDQFPNVTDQDVMSVAMYPQVAKDFLKYRGEQTLQTAYRCWLVKHIFLP